MTATGGETSHQVQSVEELEALYGEPVRAATDKVSTTITPSYSRLISAAKLYALATVGPEGVDCSPRGDAPGHNTHGTVHIANETTILLPDRRGNNRVDSLRNIVRDPRIALLFFIPGSGTTVRINGTGVVTTDPSLLSQFIVEGKTPRSVVVVTVKEVYFQCARAIVRSGMWNADQYVPASDLPSPGELLQEALKSDFDGDAYDRDWKGRALQTLW